MEAEAKSRQNVQLTHDNPVCSAEKSIAMTHMSCTQLSLHRCAELIALRSKLPCDKQEWESRALAGSKDSTSEVIGN